MMNPTKRLEQLQKRFEATSVEEAVAKMAISEALQRIDLEVDASALTRSFPVALD